MRYQVLIADIPEGYIPMICTRICFRFLTSLYLKLLCTKHEKITHENEAVVLCNFYIDLIKLLCFSNAAFPSISCSYKAGSGFLYPLERGFMFVPKPPVHIRFDEISCVNFARVQSGGGTSSRSFDFEVEHKNGSVITFSSIDK